MIEIKNLSKLCGFEFTYETHQMYNGYFHYDNWQRSLQKLQDERLSIKGYTTEPAFAKKYMDENMWGIALEFENGDWFWYHIQDWMVEWIDQHYINCTNKEVTKTQSFKFDTSVTVTRESVMQEIDRLSKQIGNSYDFNAAAWAIQTLVNAYDTSFKSDFYNDLNNSKEK